MHIIRRDLPLCPFLLHCWNSLLTLGSFFFQIPDLWNGARKTWPLIPTRRNHKRRINRNESAGQCDGFLWTLDILTGSIISSDSRFLSSSSFFLLFPPPLLFLSSSETQQVVLWRGCHTVRAGIGEKRPLRLRFFRVQDQEQIYGLGIHVLCGTQVHASLSCSRTFSRVVNSPP